MTNKIQRPHLYTLVIPQYDVNMSFDNLTGLRTDLSKYFRLRELATGAVERLTTFKDSDKRNGFYQKDFRGITVCYY